MEKKYLELIELLHKYNYYYYEKNESLVSDVEYDKLLKELEELEENYPELKISKLDKFPRTLFISAFGIFSYSEQNVDTISS